MGYDDTDVEADKIEKDEEEDDHHGGGLRLRRF
jgi:hypothetical protein